MVKFPTRSVLRGLGVLLILSASTGCASARKLSFQSNDVIVAPGEKAPFSVWLGRGASLAFKDDVPNARVEFFMDDHKLGEARTDELGRAVIHANVPPGKTNIYRAVATTPEGEREHTHGRIFRWSRQQTIIAVDMDGTVSNTNYSDLFFSLDDRVSKPLEGSAPALHRLAKKYQILYISARPRFLTEKTRRWLDHHDFPPGPVGHALSFEACLHQDTAKRDILAELRVHWPNILIGIGDKQADDKAFGANGMLTLIVNPSPGPYGRHCIVLKTWDRVDRFFETNSVGLEPAKLASLIENHEMQLQDLFN